MKKIVLLFLTVIICNVKCNAQNDFDNVAKYSITDEKASQNGNNRSFNKLYSSIETSKSIEKDFEKKLNSLGYVKTILPKDQISAICRTISNDINLKYHEVACIPSYRDIFIFQKDNKTKAVLKVCFECGMIALSGKFKSNFNYRQTNIMSNYNPLYKILDKY